MGTGAPVPRCPSPPSPITEEQELLYPRPSSQEGRNSFVFLQRLKKEKRGKKEKEEKRGVGGVCVCEKAA